MAVRDTASTSFVVNFFDREHRVPRAGRAHPDFELVEQAVRGSPAAVLVPAEGVFDVDAAARAAVADQGDFGGGSAGAGDDFEGADGLEGRELEEDGADVARAGKSKLAVAWELLAFQAVV